MVFGSDLIDGREVLGVQDLLAEPSNDLGRRRD
jgi:hypothetical protein